MQSLSASLSVVAAKYLKPYQGLKPSDRSPRNSSSQAAKYLKPYQGLKRNEASTIRHAWRLIQPQNT